jgi:hypothetical protein
LMSYIWATLAVTALIYLATLPMGYRAWRRTYGRPKVAPTVSAEEQGRL